MQSFLAKKFHYFAKRPAAGKEIKRIESFRSEINNLNYRQLCFKEGKGNSFIVIVF